MHEQGQPGWSLLQNQRGTFHCPRAEDKWKLSNSLDMRVKADEAVILCTISDLCACCPSRHRALETESSPMHKMTKLHQWQTHAHERTNNHEEKCVVSTFRHSEHVAARNAPPRAEPARARVVVLGGVLLVEGELHAVVVAAVVDQVDEVRPSANTVDFAPKQARVRRGRRETERRAHGEGVISGKRWAKPLRGLNRHETRSRRKKSQPTTPDEGARSKDRRKFDLVVGKPLRFRPLHLGVEFGHRERCVDGSRVLHLHLRLAR